MDPAALASFLADVEQLLDDPDAVAVRLRALLVVAAADRVLDGGRCRRYDRHVSPHDRLSVTVQSRRPGRQRVVYGDNATWCVVGLLQGRERATHYRVVERDGRRSLAEIATFDVHPGHVEVILPTDDLVRATTAVGVRPAVSVRVSRTVPEHGPRTPRVVEVTRAGHPRLYQRR